MTYEQVKDHVKALVKEKGLRSLAREIGFSPTYLCQCLTGKQPASDRLLLALGVERREDFVFVQRKTV